MMTPLFLLILFIKNSIKNEDLISDNFQKFPLTFDLTFSNDAGLIIEKHMRKTSWREKKNVQQHQQQILVKYSDVIFSFL